MLVAMWFIMVGLIVLVGFVTLGVVFTHYFKQWRARKRTAGNLNVTKQNSTEGSATT